MTLSTLLIDDDRSFSALAAAALQREGFPVVVAHSLNEAREAMASSHLEETAETDQTEPAPETAADMFTFDLPEDETPATEARPATNSSPVRRSTKPVHAPARASNRRAI